ncbi:MAG: hypothetical protein HN712_19240 [Gemmatimonadetes bacterium]|nr:hypothetical protein [Gemmatimonadota bacterium]
MNKPTEVGPGVSRRAVLLGLLGSLIIAAGEPFGVLVLRGSPMGADFSTGAAIFLFLPLTLMLNPLVRLLRLPVLRRGELVTIYIMMIVAAAIPSWGFTLNLIPLIGGFFYYATPENEWAQLIQPHIPAWLVPESRDAIWKLFEGGARGESVAWSSWGPPLLIWSLFAVTIYFVTLCLLVILRKQWVEREKLLFPMAVLPLEMSAEDPGRVLPPFFRSWLMWAGFLIPFVINGLEALHRYFNFIPFVNLNASIPILRNSIYLQCSPRFEVIGLSYLLSLDVGLGVWFFAFLALVQTGLERMLGWSIGPVQPFSDPASPSVAHLAQGALFFLVFAGFWHARRHLGDVWRKAIGRAPDVDDSGELLSYRAALLGTLLGSLLALVWLLIAGLNLLTALVFLIMSMVIFIGLTRIIAQTGLASYRASVASPIFTVNALGSSMVGATGLTVLGLNFAWAADVRTFVMASAATGVKLAQETALEGRRLFWAVMAAILVTLAGSAWAIVELSYLYGGINLVGWQFSGLPAFTGNWITQNLNNPQPTQPWHMGFLVLGAGLMGVMSYIKNRFVGFPIHPIGMTLGMTAPMYHLWFSVFIAWLIKVFILKYGGPRVYMQVRPFFLGMILGGFGSAGFWLIVDYFTGMTGNSFTVS